MRALDRKLTRDLVRMWGQAVTIALVVACGIASFVAMQTAYDSLVVARDAYYADRRFGDMFVTLERAPEELAGRIEAIDGVARAHTRIVEGVLVPIGDLPEPAAGRVVSLPSHGEPPLDAPLLRRGRFVEPGRTDEVVVLESFAVAHGLEPGAKLPVVLNGTLRDLTIVGVAISPEYVFAVTAGAFVQDDRRFAVLWMDRDALAPAFRMEGSFDDVVLRLQPGASEVQVEADLRHLLAPYGVVSVLARDKQPSNRVLESELSQLEQFARVLPIIFLGVAAFLVNVVLSRTLHLQRSQIATLKAVGYRDREIVIHYLEMIGVIVATGAVLGLLLGDLLGRGMLALYRPFFRFASLEYRLSPGIVATAVLVSVASGVAGALGAVYRAARLPPAEAMQPEAPVVYKKTLVERLGALRMLGTSARMVARELIRRPLRTALSCAGIAWAGAIVGGARFSFDALELLVDLQFERAQHEDMEIAFRNPLPAGVVREIAALPGVVEAQGSRAVPVRIVVDQRSRETALVGFSDAPVPLRGAALWPRRPFVLPDRGVVLGTKLAEILGVSTGGHVTLEILEGDRRTFDATVTDVLPDVFGLAVYAKLPAVQQLLGEEGNVSSVLVRVDRGAEARFVERIKKLPQVASVARRDEAMRQFDEQAGHVWVTTGILTLFGAIIAFGVVYNHARVALSMRSRDLASLRVLGFTRREISAMLLGELGFYVAVGVPIGLLLGKAIVTLIVSTIDPETYRFPDYMSARTYAFSATVTIGAALASALLVRRKLDRLDLVAVLKTRE